MSAIPGREVEDTKFKACLSFKVSMPQWLQLLACSIINNTRTHGRKEGKHEGKNENTRIIKSSYTYAHTHPRTHKQQCNSVIISVHKVFLLIQWYKELVGPINEVTDRVSRLLLVCFKFQILSSSTWSQFYLQSLPLDMPVEKKSYKTKAPQVIFKRFSPKNIFPDITVRQYRVLGNPCGYFNFLGHGFLPQGPKANEPAQEPFTFGHKVNETVVTYLHNKGIQGWSQQRKEQFSGAATFSEEDEVQFQNPFPRTTQWTALDYLLALSCARTWWET